MCGWVTVVEECEIYGNALLTVLGTMFPNTKRTKYFEYRIDVIMNTITRIPYDVVFLILNI